jgi:hypothetical protein
LEAQEFDLAEGEAGGETRVAEPSPRAAEVGLEAV